MFSKSPRPCFTISAELHEKISRSCVPIYQDPIEAVSRRTHAGSHHLGDVFAHSYRAAGPRFGRILGMLASVFGS